ncbi:MAG: hypothetical protein ABIN58_13170 [candidate division WOR-3 bacterium]
MPTLLMVLLMGCAPSVTYVIDVAYAPLIKDQPTGQTEVIRIAVIPFEDAREKQKGIGERIRITGQIDEFEARPYPASSAVTDTLLSALKIQGYQPVIAPRGKDPAIIAEGSSSKIVLSGRIEKLWAEAVSKPGHTDIKTKVSLKVAIYNASDKSTRTITVESQSEPQAVLFSPAILQNAINETLTEVINKLLTQLPSAVLTQ